jgi:chemosensory pili system protein ChpA (sensor histidine kinase/response regulator)
VTVLVVRAAGKSVAVAVDELLGKEDIVIKSLGGYAHGIGVFSGGTIASDGRVILVVDPSRVVQATPRLLPLVAGASPAEGAGRAPASHVPLETARRFLLVDDSISVRKFVGQMLERAGFSVVTAIDGADALQQLERNAIHAVVTDLEMPRVNGYELIEHLQRRASTRDLPIVILTSRSGARHEDLARQLGVKHYLTKPVDERALVDLLASLVSSA